MKLRIHLLVGSSRIRVGVGILLIWRMREEREEERREWGGQGKKLMREEEGDP